MSGQSSSNSNNDEVIAVRKPKSNVEKKYKLYLPPGKTLDMFTWDCLDVQIWMSCFLPREELAEAYLNCMKQNFDGIELYYSNGFASQNGDRSRGFHEDVFNEILRHAKVVIMESERLMFIKREEDTIEE